MLKGVVKFFNEKNKFGFVKEEETGTDYYFYIKNPADKISSGDKVTFELRESKKGKEAFNIKMIR